MLGRIALYGLLVTAVVLIVLYVRQPLQRYSGPVRVAVNSNDYGPVRVSPTPTHEPFVAPTPFVHPLESKTNDELKALLQAHDPEAQCEMGIRLRDGKGVTKDEQTADVLFGAAAKQENACALTALGNKAYNAGDYDTASQFYRKAVALGYPAAFNNLGAVARYGPAHDENEAFKWFREGAQRGYVRDYYLTGTGYMTGRYGAPDKWLAFQWYQLGADAGDQDAIYDLGWFYAYQSDEPDHYQKAMDWYKKTTCTCASYEIGRLYLNGLGTPVDVHEAARYFKIGADKGDYLAQTAYANLLRSGQLGSPDLAGALTYYRAAARQGDGEAMDEIAKMMQEGTGMPRDEAGAEALFVEAAAHCSGDSIFRLAQIAEKGSPQHPKDLDEALALYGLSIECGEDPKVAEPPLKDLLISGKVNANRSNEILHRYMQTIHDNTGNPKFEPLPLQREPATQNNTT